MDEEDKQVCILFLAVPDFSVAGDRPGSGELSRLPETCPKEEAKRLEKEIGQVLISDGTKSRSSTPATVDESRPRPALGLSQLL